MWKLTMKKPLLCTKKSSNWPTLYLRDDVIQVKILVATALMAIARRVIILDYEELEPMYIFTTGVVLVATGITYYFVHKLPPKSQSEPLEQQQKAEFQ